MRFFFDRNMPFPLARAIDALDRENTALHHDDDPRFSPTTLDIEWIRTLGQDDPRWIVISGDGRILRNQAERIVLKEAGLTFFCLVKQWNHMKLFDKAWRLIKAWPEITQNAAIGSAPRIFEVSGNGKVERIDYS